MESIDALTTRYIAAMDEDAAALGVIKPNLEPKATEFVPQIVDMVQKLIDNGFAYPAKNGDVYYEVNKFATYGRLSHKNLDDLQAGERVEINDIKKNPMDFVLWKAAKAARAMHGFRRGVMVDQVGISSVQRCPLAA
jgi:cysteinyl-tRNA synthetase